MTRAKRMRKAKAKTPTVLQAILEQLQQLNRRVTILEAQRYPIPEPYPQREPWTTDPGDPGPMPRFGPAINEVAGWDRHGRLVILRNAQHWTETIC